MSKQSLAPAAVHCVNRECATLLAHWVEDRGATNVAVTGTTVRFDTDDPTLFGELDMVCIRTNWTAMNSVTEAFQQWLSKR